MAIQQEQIQQVSSRMMNACSEISELARESLSVGAQSAAAWSKGLNEIYSSLGSLVQNSLNHSIKASEAFLGAKNIQDIVSTQSSLIKSSIESATTELSNISQASARTAKQAAEPITNHINSAIGKLTKSKAA